jgi:site-specific DNA-methyltransferase (adenine-specific)
MGKDSKPNGPLKGAKAKPPNSLYYGDNLEIMRKYLRDESVDLCYMDPPFNSNRSYNQIYSKPGESQDAAQAQAFIDTWEWDTRAMAGFKEILENAHARFSKQLVDLVRGLHRVLGEHSLFAYLVGMSLRLVEIHRILKTTGSFYLHCDPTASHYLKIMLDAIFDPANFRNEIIWRRSGAHSPKKGYGPIHDTLLFYSKDPDSYYFNSLKRPYMKGHVGSRYTTDETGRLKFTSGGNILTGSGKRSGESGKPWRGFDPTAKDRHWAVPGFLGRQMPSEFAQLGVLAKLEALYSAKLVDIVSGAAWPTPVRYLSDYEGSQIQDIWAYQPYTEGTVHGTQEGVDSDVKWLGPTDPERTGYQTQKPLGLLDRIILTSSNEGDVVFDPCCGCGTTIAAADLKQRKWIGIDITYQSIALVLKRLEDQSGTRWLEVEQSIAMTGIPRDMGSAVALAHKKDDRVRKEFEKWAVLTYTNNRGKINEKKGADAGIDGRVHFMTGRTESATMIFQVKSGIVHRDDIAKLRGDMEKDGAALATLITLTEPTDPMFRDARAAGLYRHELMDRDYDRIQIVTIQEILDGTRLDIPLVKDLAVKKPGKKTAVSDELTLPGLDGPREEAPPDPIDMMEHLKGAFGRRAPKRATSAESKLKTDKKGDKKPSRQG